MSEFLILCGAPTYGAKPRNATVIELAVSGRSKNVKLQVDDIWQPLLGNVPDVLMDLLEVAAYVYCADQRASRGSLNLTDYGVGWRRSMRFVIAVRQPDIWSDPDVTAALENVLSFLSGEHFEFSFVPTISPVAQSELYFNGIDAAAWAPDEVALFSGGIDSFAGAVEALVGNNQRVALVGHWSSSKVAAVQRHLVDGLVNAGFASQLRYIPVTVTNTDARPVEFTQRTRSFLFASLAVVIAQMAGRNAFTFYENGVLSLNVALAGDVLGARATRTTHPRVLRGFEAFFSALLDVEMTVESPFQWLTKKEVTGKIADHGFAKLLGTTNSCTRPRSWTGKQDHCGVCSQCIDRRFGVLAAGLGDFERADRYKTDVLLGERHTSDDLRMGHSFVQTLRTLINTTPESLISTYPALTTAFGSYPGMTNEQAMFTVHALLARHADQGLGVVATAQREHALAIAKGSLPPRSLLAICSHRQLVEAVIASDLAAQVIDFVDRLTPARCEFAVDTAAKAVKFAGGFQLEGANFNIFEALLDGHRAAKALGAEVPFLSNSRLSEQLGYEGQSLRQQVTRARDVANNRLSVDLGVVFPEGGIIENQKGHGYRLSPVLREVALADLEQLSSQTPRPDVTNGGATA
ncbi:MAG: hypothetical protein JWR75_1757 [Devosia sp.]|nr:hypothetical protein [Devosia sp.]